MLPILFFKYLCWNLPYPKNSPESLNQCYTEKVSKDDVKEGFLFRERNQKRKKFNLFFLPTNSSFLYSIFSQFSFFWIHFQFLGGKRSSILLLLLYIYRKKYSWKFSLKFPFDDIYVQRAFPMRAQFNWID